MLGALLRKADQIPVYRGTARAADALVAAEAALAQGECVAVFPEGTLTRDPAMWPMTGKTGVARLALRTHVPVIPIAQWGAHVVLPPYAATLPAVPPQAGHGRRRAAGRPRRPLRPAARTRPTLQEATRRIMAALTAQLAEIRGETPPPARPTTCAATATRRPPSTPPARPARRDGASGSPPAGVRR